MASPRDTRDPSQRRDDGMGLLAFVVAILAGTAWTVGAFVENSPTASHAAITPPVQSERLSSGECEACDAQTLAPLPSWHSSAIAPETLLRSAASADPSTAGSTAGSRDRRVRRRTGAAGANWVRVSAPAESNVNG